MSLRTHTCLSVACDECQIELNADDEDEGGIWHFTTRREATEVALECEWIINGERALCSQCARVAGCELLGHQWQVLHPTGSVPTSGAVRICLRCSTCGYDSPLPGLSE